MNFVQPLIQNATLADEIRGMNVNVEMVATTTNRMAPDAFTVVGNQYNVGSKFRSGSIGAGMAIAHWATYSKATIDRRSFHQMVVERLNSGWLAEIDRGSDILWYEAVPVGVSPAAVWGGAGAKKFDGYRQGNFVNVQDEVAREVQWSNRTKAEKRLQIEMDGGVPPEYLLPISLEEAVHKLFVGMTLAMGMRIAVFKPAWSRRDVEQFTAQIVRDFKRESFALFNLGEYEEADEE